MYRCVILMLFLFPLQLYADVKIDKAITLLQMQGVDEVISDKIEEGELEIINSAKELLNKYAAEIQPNEEYIRKFEAAANSFYSKAAKAVTAEEMFNTTAKYYALSFTSDELDQLIVFYSSPLGKKEIKITDEAISSLKSHLSKITKPAIESATNKFITELSLLVKECNCPGKVITNHSSGPANAGH